MPQYARVRRCIATAAIACLGLTGCGQESRVQSGNAGGVLHVALHGEPQTLDPHIASGIQEHMLIGALFERLVTVDPDSLEFLPGVARDWEFDADGMGAHFYLRSDARWSNGDPVTAGDFVFAWQRAINPKLGNQVAEVLFPLANAERIYRAQEADPRTLGVTAVDDHTLRLDFEYPVPAELMLFNLAHATTSPLHRDTLWAHGAADARYAGWAKPGHLVGNGAFILDSWRMQRDLTMRPNRHYWDAQRVALRAVKFYPVESTTAQERMFRRGQIHITAALPRSKVPVYRGMDGSPLVEMPVLRTDYVATNLRRTPLDDRDVRRALALAIDREALAGPVYNDAATPLGRYTPDGLGDYRPPQGIRHDPETARGLLAGAGYPDGEGFPPLELLVPASETGRALATALRQLWKDTLNIDIQAVSREYRVYLDALVQGEFDLAWASWGGLATPDTFMNRWVTGGGTNDSRFSNAEFDYLINVEQRSSADMEELLSIYRRAEQVLLRELPVLPLFQAHSVFLVQPAVRGLSPNVFEGVDFSRVSLDSSAAAWAAPP